MKQSLSYLRTASTLFAVVLAPLLTTPCANADQWDKRTILKVNETIQVQDAVLKPGQYVLKLLNSPSDRHIVQIFNNRENHIVATILAIPEERMQPTGKTQFTFWETPSGTAKALRAWYYPGDLIGQEFRYPKHPYELAMAISPTPTPTPGAEETEPTPAEIATSTPEANAAPSTPEPNVAEAAPPMQTPEPAPTADQTPTPPTNPEPQPAEPQELPKTASPYPLVGFSGGVLLALGGLLRLRRPSFR